MSIRRFLHWSILCRHLSIILSTYTYIYSVNYLTLTVTQLHARGPAFWVLQEIRTDGISKQWEVAMLGFEAWWCLFLLWWWWRPVTCTWLRLCAESSDIRQKRMEVRAWGGPSLKACQGGASRLASFLALAPPPTRSVCKLIPPWWAPHLLTPKPTFRS